MKNSIRVIVPAALIALLALPAAGARRSKPKKAIARKTVAAAPLSTVSGQEYAWVGQAIADALSLRIHQQSELNALTLRQVNAAMRQEGLERDALLDEKAAYKLGRQLGADVLLVGSYEATWPDVTVVVKAIDPQKKEVISDQQIQGGLEDLFQLEARIARALAQALGAEKPDVAVGAFGTTTMRAWRAATLGFEILNAQSLSPRAADPNAPLRLPRTAIETAHDWFRRATRYDPDYGDAWAGLGVAQALLGQMTQAWRSLGKATALGFGHHPTAALGASFVRMREGRWDEAAKILHSAVERHPGFLHARGYLGQLYNHQGRHREARKVFTDYTEVAPNNPWVLAQRGYTKAKLRDHVGAIADTQAALEKLPESPSLLLELASRYIDSKKLVGAEDALQHALELHPKMSTIYVRLGYVYLLQGKEDMAIPITKKAFVEANFGNNRRNEAYAHINLVRAYGHKGQLEEAFEHLEKARSLNVISLAEVEDDPKLEKLRKDPRYAKLMQ